MKKLFYFCIFLFSFLQILDAPLIRPRENKFPYPKIWDILYPIAKKYKIKFKEADMVMWLESRRKTKCKEWKKISGKWKIISRGIFQLCTESILDYWRCVLGISIWNETIEYWKKKGRYDRRYEYVYQCFIQHRNQWAYDAVKNTEVFCWSFSYYLRVHKGSYYKAMSCHNMGLRGFRNYQRRTGNYCYWKYVNKVNSDYKIWERRNK